MHSCNNFYFFWIIVINKSIKLSYEFSKFEGAEEKNDILNLYFFFLGVNFFL